MQQKAELKKDARAIFLFPSHASNILSFPFIPPATVSTGTAIQALLPTLTRIMRTILAAATMRAVRVLTVPTAGFTDEDEVTGNALY